MDNIKECLTFKQEMRIRDIINFYGEGKVNSYIKYFYPSANINNLTKIQAQKIITGLVIPKIITNVYKRDYF